MFFFANFSFTLLGVEPRREACEPGLHSEAAQSSTDDIFARSGLSPFRSYG